MEELEPCRLVFTPRRARSRGAGLAGLLHGADDILTVPAEGAQVCIWAVLPTGSEQTLCASIHLSLQTHDRPCLLGSSGDEGGNSLKYSQGYSAVAHACHRASHRCYYQPNGTRSSGTRHVPRRHLYMHLDPSKESHTHLTGKVT
jgi:hypothetical protein